MTEIIARLHIVLADTDPAIWRKVEVPVDASLKILHDIVSNMLEIRKRFDREEPSLHAMRFIVNPIFCLKSSSNIIDVMNASRICIFESACNRSIKHRQAGFPLVYDPYTFPQNFAARIVSASLDELTDERFQLTSEIRTACHKTSPAAPSAV